MKTLWKKLSVLMLVICLTVCGAVLSACGEDDPPENNATEITYTVTVKLPDGSPVAGIFLQLCISGDTGACFPFTDENYNPILTNENGVTSKVLARNDYHAKILSGLPAGYTYEKDADGYYTGAEATPTNPSITITLIAE